MTESEAGCVLLIDDSAVARGRFANWLSSAGWDVLESATGADAVHRVRTELPDVVLCDLHMPDGDGFSVIEALRRAGLQVPVVILSTDQGVDAVLSALRRGAFDYVFKSIDPLPLLAAMERAACFMAVVRDNQRLSSALVLAKEHALSASRAKSAFLSNMSHELRTPLNAMLGYAELLAETVEEPRLVADLGRIVYSGHHLLSLIDDVLDLARVEAGHARLDVAEVDVCGVIESLRLQTAPAVQRHRLNFVVDVEAGCDGLVADRRLLQQCLHQLIDNAIKFTDRGSITVRVRRVDDELMFDVIDTGQGISVRSQAAIFDAFSHGDLGSDGRLAGPGLGLTIALRLCELMGARLSLQSEVGTGSTFTVAMPIRPVREAQAEASDSVA